jgi:hypothetical protein
MVKDGRSFPGPDDVHRYGGRNGIEEISEEESNGFNDRQEKNGKEYNKTRVPEQGGEQNEDKHGENKKGAERKAPVNQSVHGRSDA